MTPRCYVALYIRSGSGGGNRVRFCNLNVSVRPFFTRVRASWNGGCFDREQTFREIFLWNPPHKGCEKRGAWFLDGRKNSDNIFFFFLNFFALRSQFLGQVNFLNFSFDSTSHQVDIKIINFYKYSILYLFDGRKNKEVETIISFLI